MLIRPVPQSAAAAAIREQATPAHTCMPREREVQSDESRNEHERFPEKHLGDTTIDTSIEYRRQFTSATRLEAQPVPYAAHAVSNKDAGSMNPTVWPHERFTYLWGAHANPAKVTEKTITIAETSYAILSTTPGFSINRVPLKAPPASGRKSLGLGSMPAAAGFRLERALEAELTT